MTKIIFLFIFLVPINNFAQKIERNKQNAINEITREGKTVHKMDGDDNSFYYTRYDEIGEAIVLYTCEGNYVRKVVFICEDPTHVPKRALQAFKTAKNYKVDPDLQGVFTGTNSCYYDGNARYEGVQNFNSKKFYLEILLHD